MRPVNRTQLRRVENNTAPVQNNSRIPSDFLRELQSAASMIMSPEECAELEQEFQVLRRPRPVIAA